jgi:serine/threonine protein kinase
MGTVFLAEQIGVGNRPIALKVLLRTLLDNPDFLRRFRDEAASTGRIRHPNVVTIYESGQGDDGTPYIAMEYLEGETLRHALETRGALPLAECAEILQQAARGLSAAHKLGIIHRDLKPDNIFLTPAEDVGEGSPTAPGQAALSPAGRSPSAGAGPREPGGLPYMVKLVDFGIAKLRESATHTLTGTVLGTPAYMSYEQASGMKSDELDARSDIYSLGVVAYEMLTGRVPFESDTPLGYLRKHMQDAPPPFRAVKPDLPALPEVESVVMKGLSKDRDKRCGSVLEFAREFADAAAAAELRYAAVAGLRREPGEAGPTRVVRATPFTPEHTLTGDGGVVWCVAFSPDGKLLASTALDQAIRLWDVVTGTLRQTLAGHDFLGGSIAFSPDGKLLAFGSEDKSIKLCDVSSGRLRRTLKGHTGWVYSVAFSPDGKLLASTALDGAIRLWDVASAATTKTLTAHSPFDHFAVFSPDGELLATGSFDKVVKLWDVASGTLRQTLTGHYILAKSIAFSPDGKLLACGGMDKTINLWDVASGQLRRTLKAHTGWVSSVAFSPDGKLLAFASSDNMVGLWDVASGTLMQGLAGHTDWVSFVAFSPDGKLLASGSHDKTIKLWRKAK